MSHDDVMCRDIKIYDFENNMALAYSGEVAIRSALASQFRVQHADHNFKTTIVTDASQAADATVTLPATGGKLVSNPAPGTLAIERTSALPLDANSALLEVGGSAADDGGQLRVHAATEDGIRFAVTDTAVTASLPLVCTAGIESTMNVAPELRINSTADGVFRLSVVSGSLVVQHSADDGDTWSDPLQAWTPAS